MIWFSLAAWSLLCFWPDAEPPIEPPRSAVDRRGSGIRRRRR